MSDVCVTTTCSAPPMDRRRQLAWQLTLCAPCVLIGIEALTWQQPPAAYWQTVSGILLLALVAVASVTDLKWHKIPNWLTYSALGWAILINAVAQFSSPNTAQTLGAVGLGDSLAGAGIPFFFMLVIFSLTGGGAGDVKLTAAMGALLGLDRTIDVILLSFIFAGGMALLRAVWLLGPKQLLELLIRTVGHWIFPLWMLPPSAEQRKFMRQPMPLGPSFAAGAALVVFGLDVAQLWQAALTLGGAT